MTQEWLTNLFILDWWNVVGLVGQIFFMLSFIVQWIESEKQKQSVLPKAFWYLRLVGAFFLLVYVIYRRDLIFTTAFVLQIGIYCRNLMFWHQKPAVANQAGG